MPSPVGEAIDLLSRSGEAAFAIDASDRLVYWNKGCEDLLGYEAQKVLGKACYDVMGGRDEHGNVYCFRNCPVAHQARHDEDDAVQPFVLSVKDKQGRKKNLTVSMFAVPAVKPSLSAVVHVIRENGAPASPLEKTLAKQAAAAPASRWPILSSEGQPVELTAREKEILRCLAEGLATGAIAEKLFIAPVTVRNHVQSILQKLDVHTKLAAVVYAYRHQLL
ncbi:MAG TPA: LuxR C-terminal-related transcriptional regulator [Thermoanaerobaculia bacterium]|nr:LuxR C-terminal-related transcriptional regulator [Thermoanaerobaculia bacterium]